MLETAKKEGYAYPAVNVTTIEVINGALRAFSEAKSDGIIQVSIGGGKFASGSFVGNSALGAIVLAEATRRLAEKHNVLVALHTDHCQPEHVDTFLRPLIAESRRRVERGEAPLFNSHMLDASTLPMAEASTMTAFVSSCTASMISFWNMAIFAKNRLLLNL